ncbi:AAA family ATPase [Nocardia sp. 004]|uniref:nucleotide-binding protein n=1 Tax=Nocardia sp. 004 TaxID=3385978 RepID=UPI0039A0B4CD
MSRGNDDLPMLPPWLSESEVTQVGYETPVQNLPHDELIEETPSRKRGLFRNRAAEAEQPESTRAPKRRIGRRRDKADGQETSGETTDGYAASGRGEPLSEQPRPLPEQAQPLSEQPRQNPPAPGPPLGPAISAPDAYPHRQQPAPEHAPPHQGGTRHPPQRTGDIPRYDLPARAPAQPAPEFRPLGNEPTETRAVNYRAAPRHDHSPDPQWQPHDGHPGPTPRSEPVPRGERPSPPLGPDTADRGSSAGHTAPGPRIDEWPSTGNPRIDAALSSVRPNQQPATPPRTPPEHAAPATHRDDTRAPDTGANPHLPQPDNRTSEPPTGGEPPRPPGEQSVMPPAGPPQDTARSGPPQQPPAPALAGSGALPPWHATPGPTRTQAPTPENTAHPDETAGRAGASGSAKPTRTQQVPDAAISNQTSTATGMAGATAAAQPAGSGRHRLPTENDRPLEENTERPVQPAQGIPSREHTGHTTQFANTRPASAEQHDPARNAHDSATHPNQEPTESSGRPAQFGGGSGPATEPTAGRWHAAAWQHPAQEYGRALPYSSPPAQPHPAPPAQPHPGPPEYGYPAAQANAPHRDNPYPPAPQPGTQFQQPSLDQVPLRRAKRAPGTGWRKAVHHASGGAINLGMSAEELRLQELVARIRQPVRGDYRIAVLSLKGGVGKTTTTMGIGSIFASIRGDRVIAVDANPDFGTLSQRVPLQTRSTVRDLLLDPNVQRYSDVRRHTSQSTSRLEVLASERDPAASESFNEEEYRAVARILQRFYNIILTDCGTGLMHSAMSGVLDLAHSLVLISSPAIDGARSAAATLDWLSLHGHDHLVRNAVVVINSPRAGSPNVGIQQLREYFLSRCRAVHIIPFDPHISEGAEIDLHRLHKQTKRAYVELAATIADDFATDHHHYRS